MKTMKVALLFLSAVAFIPISCSRQQENVPLEVELFHQGSSVEIAAQIEIISPKGIHVLFDVVRPEKLSRTPEITDILLTSHMHYDHYMKEFANHFPGKQRLMKTNRVKSGDVSAYGVAAAHGREPPGVQPPSNFIYVVEVAGLRIAHFGDTEQEELSAEQLRKIGRVDIAISEFLEELPGSFTIMDQVQPKLIIPTHFGGGMAEKVSVKWPCFWTDKMPFLIATEKLPRETTFIFMGPADQGERRFLEVKTWEDP